MFLTRPLFKKKTILGLEITLRGQFVIFLHADSYINLNDKQRKFRITPLLFPETNF